MTSAEVIEALRDLGPQDLNVVFTYLAERVPDVRLEDGRRLCDATDFQQWLHELAANIQQVLVQRIV